MNNDPKNSIKRFLKEKVEIKETAKESVDEFIRKKLIDEPRQLEAERNSFWFRLKKRFAYRYETFYNKIMIYRKRKFKRFMNETFPILTFILFSSYIVYLMEFKYTQMKDKVTASKSLKQIQIEEENEEIRRALFGGPDDNNKNSPIIEKNRKQKYKFEYFDEDESEDDEIEFTTKNELLEQIYLDYLKGESVPPQYEKALKKYMEEKAQQEGK